MANIGCPMGFAATEVDQVASGLLALANVQMGAAIKEVTVERGKDIREFALFAFGGGGPLHACDVARELGIKHVIVPPEPGNFSALGMLFAPARIDEARTVPSNFGTVRNDCANSSRRWERSQVQPYDEISIAMRSPSNVRLRCATKGSVTRSACRSTRRSKRPRFVPVSSISIKALWALDLEAPAELVGVRVTAYADVEGPDLRALHRAPQSVDASP